MADEGEEEQQLVSVHAQLPAYLLGLHHLSCPDGADLVRHL